MAPTARGIAWRVLLIGVLLAFPVWYRPLMRRVDSQMSRRELAIEAERRARAAGELVRLPSGEKVRAVAYTPSDPTDAQLRQYLTWLSRLVALALFFQLVAGAHYSAERQAEIDE